MQIITPVVRLTLGILLLTVSLLLVGDLMGLMPDHKKNLDRERLAITESLALQVSIAMADDNMDQLQTLLRILQSSNETIESIGVRSSAGKLVIAEGVHDGLWRKGEEQASGTSQIALPLHNASGRMGMLEIRFTSPEQSLFEVITSTTVLGVVLFIIIAGYFVYLMFLKRALQELDPNAVVPERVKHALDSLAEGLIILDRSGLILFSNESFIRKVGIPTARLTGLPLSSLAWEIPDDAGQELPWNSLLSSGTQTTNLTIRLRINETDLQSYSVNTARIDDPRGDLAGVMVTFSDLTELEKSHQDLARVLVKLKASQKEIARQNEELQILASYDALTGILNRRSLFEGLNALISEVEQEEGIFSCIMADIDHFKLVNDRFGHATGDKVIKTMAQVLTKMTRPEDLVGRYGGEEFCVVLKDMTRQQALEIAERIRKALASLDVDSGTGKINFTSSLGVSSYTGGRISAEEIVDQADQALYQAKEGGRNRVVHWQEMDGNEHSDQQPTIAAEEPDQAEPDNSENKVPPVSEAAQQQLITEIQTDKPQEAESDGFTSRVMIVDRIRQNILRYGREKQRISLLCMGTDAIEQVQSSWGFTVADKLTRKIVNRIKEKIRDSDTLSRNGLDPAEISLSRMGRGEFIVLLNAIDNNDSATWIVQRIMAALKEPFLIEGIEILVVPNFGISSFPEDGDNAETLLANASAALAEAKLLGKGNSIFFSEEIHQRSREQLNLSAALKSAIRHDGLFLEYLPQVDIASGKITGVEALLRWYQPEMGMVDTRRLIRLAEAGGLLQDIGRWVINVACDQLKTWHSLTGNKQLVLTVNLTASQLRDAGLEKHIFDVLEKHNLDGTHLRIDFKEHSLLEADSLISKRLENLSRKGIGLTLDDFGTGYSSLLSLKNFDVDWVKIDSSFVSGLDKEAGDTSIVAAVISMAHNLGVKVVAEGVSQPGQASMLKVFRCDEVQGALYSTALDKEGCTNLLMSHTHLSPELSSAETQEPNHEPIFQGVLNQLEDSGYQQ